MSAVEAGIAVAFVVVAAAGVTRPTWLLVAGLAGHRVKDLWPHRTMWPTRAGGAVLLVMGGRRT